MSKHFKDNLAETVFHILAESHYKGKTVIVAGKKGIVGKQVGKDGDTENDEIYKVRFEDGTVKDIPVRDMEIQSDDNKKTGENEMEDLVKEAKTPLVITDPSKRARKETTPEREKPGKDVLVRTGPGGDFTKDIKTTDVKKGMRGILGLFKKESVNEAKLSSGAKGLLSAAINASSKGGHPGANPDNLKHYTSDAKKNAMNFLSKQKIRDEHRDSHNELKQHFSEAKKHGPAKIVTDPQLRLGLGKGQPAGGKVTVKTKSGHKEKVSQDDLRAGADLFDTIKNIVNTANTSKKKVNEIALPNKNKPKPKKDKSGTMQGLMSPEEKGTKVGKLSEGSLGYKKALRARGKKKKGMRSGDAKEKAMDFRRAASEEQKNKENHQLDEAGPLAIPGAAAIGKGLMWGLTALGIGSAVYQGLKGDKPKGSGGSPSTGDLQKDRARERRAAGVERAKQSGSIYQRPASKTTPKDAFHRVTSGTRHLRKPRIPQSSIGARSRLREQVEIVESSALAGRALGGLARGGRALGQQGVRGNLTARLARTRAFRDMAARLKKKGAGKTGLKKFARDKSVIPLAKASGAKVQKATTKPISGGKASKAKKASKSSATGLNLKDIPVGKIMMYPGMPGFNFAMDAVRGTTKAIASPFTGARERRASAAAYMEQKSNDGE